MVATSTPARPVLLAALTGLLIAPALAGAAPAISGGDGDQWNTAPTYTVTPDEDATATFWGASNNQGNVTLGPSAYTITLDAGIAEGPHTLTVAQTRRGGPETTTRRFIVDRTAPGAVRLGGPGTVTSDTAFGVSWSGQEAGARAVWTVRATASGSRVPVVGPITATASRADIPGLPTGAYTVQVVQTDAAGNSGPAAVLPVEVIAGAGAPPPAALTPPAPTPAAPSTPATPPEATPTPTPTVTVVKLPALRTSRLLPRRAAVVKSLRPLLRWAKGPAGTTIYNVQIFRVGTPTVNASSNAAPLRKIRSVFPTRRQLRTPALTRGACYVWRVWPYRGAIFTKTPLGVSHFCVAARAR